MKIILPADQELKEHLLIIKDGINYLNAIQDVHHVSNGVTVVVKIVLLAEIQLHMEFKNMFLQHPYMKEIVLDIHINVKIYHIIMIMI